VERGRVLDGSTIRTGDALVGLASPNLRSNGFSLVRRVVFDMAARSLDEPAWPGSSATLGEELLSPSVVYSPAVLATLAGHEVHGVVHITGGGLPGNLTRVLGGDLDAVVEASAWEVPRVFEEIRAMGGIELSEMERVFNMGIGMVLVVPPGGVDAVTTTLADHDCPATTIGEVVDGTGRVEIRR
jgi:phosphoribosylformylglycinamidine cyclo-ligase